MRDNESAIHPQDLPDYPNYLSLKIVIGFGWNRIAGLHLVSCKKFVFWLDFIEKFRQILRPVGGSFNGRTTGSGPVNGGSTPPPPARIFIWQRLLLFFRIPPLFCGPIV